MKRADRRARTKKFVAKQLRIARLCGILNVVAGKFKKKHALDCGNPRCRICGNPRKLWKTLPIKEQSMKEAIEMDTSME